MGTLEKRPEGGYVIKDGFNSTDKKDMDQLGKEFGDMGGQLKSVKKGEIKVSEEEIKPEATPEEKPEEKVEEPTEEKTEETPTEPAPEEIPAEPAPEEKKEEPKVEE